MLTANTGSVIRVIRLSQCHSWHTVPLLLVGNATVPIGAKGPYMQQSVKTIFSLAPKGVCVELDKSSLGCWSKDLSTRPLM